MQSFVEHEALCTYEINVILYFKNLRTQNVIRKYYTRTKSSMREQNVAHTIDKWRMPLRDTSNIYAWHIRIFQRLLFLRTQSGVSFEAAVCRYLNLLLSDTYYMLILKCIFIFHRQQSA